MTSIDIYTVPRDQVDVEALAGQFVKYLQINAIDVQELSEHPQRRDAIIAELYARLETKPTFWPKDTVGADLPPGEVRWVPRAGRRCDRAAHAPELARGVSSSCLFYVTLYLRIFSRVLRSHLASAALMVVYQ